MFFMEVIKNVLTIAKIASLRMKKADSKPEIGGWLYEINRNNKTSR